MEYIHGSFSNAKRTMTSHYGQGFYTDGPGCMGNDYDLMPNEPADLSSCTVASGGRLKRFVVAGSEEPDRVLDVSYVFEGGAASPSELSSLLGSLPLVSTKDVPLPLQPLFPRVPDARLYRSQDGSLLVRLTDEGSASKPSQVATVFNLSSIELFSESIHRCLRAYKYVE